MVKGLSVGSKVVVRRGKHAGYAGTITACEGHGRQRKWVIPMDGAPPLKLSARTLSFEGVADQSAPKRQKTTAPHRDEDETSEESSASESEVEDGDADVQT